MKLVKLIEPLTTINPQKTPEKPFRYIDVSSVSRSTFSIDSVSELLGSEAPSRARRLVKAGDVLFATIRPTLQRIAIVPEELDGSVCSTGFFVLRAQKGVLGKFLFYSLFTRAFSDEMESVQRGASYPAVSDSDVKCQRISIPPLPEQKRIVAILDEAFAGIERAVANTEKNLANARELLVSYLDFVFQKRGEGWIEKAVGEVADHCLGKMLDKRKNKGDFRPYLRNLNVQWFSVNTSHLLEMRFEEKEEKRYKVEKGDLLICEGGYPGRAAIWEKDEPIFFQKAIHRVRFHELLYNRWFLYFLFLTDSRGDLPEYFTGAGIQHFTGQSLKKFRLPLAPKKEAILLLNKFDDLFEEVQLLESIYEKKLAALSELKQSLLQKAFSGELTADPERELKEAAA